MTAQFEGTANQQLWDEALKTVLNLSNTTLKQNLELEARVAELELELSVWKQAHSVAMEAAERDAKAHNVHIVSLNKQISNKEGFRGNGNPLILCAINGQKMFFNQSLLVQGFIGGQTAAQHLMKIISEYLSPEGVQIFGRLSFWISIYFNKIELVNGTVAHNICSRDQLEGFLAGFSQTSSRFTAIDVGIGEDGADHKIREYVQTYARFPEVLKVLLGGCSESDPLYSGTFNRLDSDGMLGKLVLLRSISEEWPEQAYAIPVLNVDRLLMRQNYLPHPLTQRLTPLSMASVETVPTNGGLISPQSPVRNPLYVDPKFPLHKQAPPPCNEHYLMTCSKGFFKAGACKYSHDYVLSPEQLANLAANAKKAPCNWLKNGLSCPYGEACCWGHVCPNGNRCFHLSKGRCWFKGEGMHIAQAQSPSG
ncbi:hypothetical protein BDP27DRAFT_1415150 [Rhodocollybia butyracea]|uniref:C3H1-type domain-containing protein n=1 Tax=Rhodocollybia butyracea TaxID=206335 RepID=A0A9P5Q944_9AGAR|nr:hypothetical protein BDP27DRAFT_1415150 [Rhodocollybia butyracea]